MSTALHKHESLLAPVMYDLMYVFLQSETYRPGKYLRSKMAYSQPTECAERSSPTATQAFRLVGRGFVGSNSGCIVRGVVCPQLHVAISFQLRTRSPADMLQRQLAVMGTRLTLETACLIIGLVPVHVAHDHAGEVGVVFPADCPCR
jgi:hypothetical protein